MVGPAREVITIGPERYSELYCKFGNLNRMLAWAHGKVIANLHGKVPDCPRALSDQCGDARLVEGELRRQGVELKLEQRTKAESDIAVAAASILARAEFVRQLAKLSVEAGVELGKVPGPESKSRRRRFFENPGGRNWPKYAKLISGLLRKSLGIRCLPKWSGANANINDLQRENS